MEQEIYYFIMKQQYNLSKELNDIINQYKNKPLNGLVVFIRYNEQIKNEIYKLTSFLDKEYSLSARLYCILNNIFETPCCPVCGKHLPFMKINKGFYKTCGSDFCKKERMKYGGNKDKDYNLMVKHMQETNLKKYGAISNLSGGTNSRKFAQEKLKEKYGVDSPLKSIDIKNKMLSTIYNKYGVNYYTQSDDYKIKLNKTIIDKYGSHENFQNIIHDKQSKTLSNNKFNDILNKLNEMNYEYISSNTTHDIFTLKCPKCNTIINNILRQNINYHYRNKTDICPKCGYNDKFRSNFEKDVVNEILKFYKYDVQQNRQYLGLECDIICPKNKIAIECNGLYWHSELFKDKFYHQNKKKLIEEKGYNLITIWEDDWNDTIKKQIIISRLKSKLNSIENKIYARKCIIKEIDGKYTKQFLEKNHLQGYAPSSINIGLYYNNDLVCLTTFSKNRKSISGNREGYELIRMCNKINTEVIGGFSKLIKYFINVYNPKALYSYSDLDWVKMNNNSYEKIGFGILKITTPDYKWCVKGIRKNRLLFQKKNLINQGYDSSKTEIQIMHENKFYRIFGTGNLLLEYKQ